MANPNLASVTNIKADSLFVNLTTSDTQILENAAASNQLVKVSALIVANKATSPASVTLQVRRSAADFPIAWQILIPANSTVVIVGKDAPIYLEEGDALRGLASANSALVLTVSFETLS
jgi:hypothetical protein